LTPAGPGITDGLVNLLKAKAVELWKAAWQLQRQGDVERAIDLYSQSIGIWPTPEAYTFRGWAYSHQSRFEDAIDECKKAIEVDPSFGNPYNDIGSYLIQLGRAGEAIEWLEKAKSAPRYEPRHFPYLNLGRVYAQKGLLVRAAEEFRGALEHKPDDPASLQALAELQRKMN
jgi:Tfp pilus assembly protein PilF